MVKRTEDLAAAEAILPNVPEDQLTVVRLPGE